MDEIISYDESLRLVLDNVSESPVVYKNLHEAMDECLAENVYADRSYPPYNRAAMDGFAIRSRDFKDASTSFPIIGTQLAGKDLEIEVKANTAIRLMTGAAVPEGYDAVVRFEDASVDKDSVSFNLKKVEPGQNISRKGSDTKDRELLIKKGTRLGNAAMNVAASVGHTPVQVYPKPTVALLSTGNEIIPIEQVPREYQIRNSNAFSIRSFLYQYKIEPIFQTIVPDNKEEMEKAFRKGANADILIITGGFSKGESDYVPEILSTIGVNKLFHRVNIKPGRPTWFGKKEKITAVFGLPGNPVSNQITFKVYIESYIRKYMGLDPIHPLYLPLSKDVVSSHGRAEFIVARVISDDRSSWVEPVSYHDSGDFIGILESDGYFYTPANRDNLNSGELVPFYFWSTIF